MNILKTLKTLNSSEWINEYLGNYTRNEDLFAVCCYIGGFGLDSKYLSQANKSQKF